MTMDVREKLAELLKSVLPNFRNNMAYWGEKPIYEFADCLLANGVTVQEWISVEDRLPEQGEKAICIDADGDMMIGKYTEWGWMFPCYFEDLTHWMPIPHPPEGD